MLAMSIDSSFKKTYIKERRKIKYQHKEEMDVKRRFLLFFFFGWFVYRIGDIRACLMDYRKDPGTVGMEDIGKR